MIQDDFNSQSGDFQMSPGEYEGPLSIGRSCVVDGGMATLWAGEGPVLIINAPAVTVKNLRVEVTGSAGQIAIQTNFPDTLLSGVEVNGDVSGFAAEAPVWRLPPVISLGVFAAGQVNTFSYELDVPMDARLVCSLQDISVSPDSLTRGKNRLFIKTSKIKENTIVYGEIMIQSTVSRRIYLSGKAEAGAPLHEALPEPQPAPSASVSVPENVPVKGQRLPVEEHQAITAIYECRGCRKPLDIDGYVFLLQDNGKVSGDNDLIFFGNPVSADGCVSIDSGVITVRLDRAAARISRIAVCFSIYGADPSENFSLVDAPAVRLQTGGQDFCRFPLSGLGIEKTVVALELYRYKGTWKIHFAGSGYRSGLETLCESYGIEVEQA